MRISSVYLQHLQNKIDQIANNLANISTPGFKQQLLSLEEYYDIQDKNNTEAQYGGMPVTQNPVIRTDLYSGRRYDFSQGGIFDTGNPLDMAVCGEGFFQVKTDSGVLGYTRAGVFSTDAAGNLVNNKGMLLEPPINIPLNASDVHVEEDGRIRGTLITGPDDLNDYSNYFESEEDQKAGIATFGRIALYRFANPDGLELAGNDIFLPTDVSGRALEGTAGEDGYGVIKGSTLERSNTDVINAMTSLIQIQRVYGLNLRITQNQDEMSVLAAQMRG